MQAAVVDKIELCILIRRLIYMTFVFQMSFRTVLYPFCWDPITVLAPSGSMNWMKKYSERVGIAWCMSSDAV